jgi:hypothetical protein
MEEDSNLTSDKNEPDNSTVNASESTVKSTESANVPISDSTETTPIKNNNRFKLPKLSLNRNTILAGSLALILLVVGTLSLVLTRQNNQDLSNEEVVTINQESEKLGAAILLSEGTLQTKPIDSGDWEDATTETEIGQGTAIRTVGASSRAVIAFDDGSALRLDANSEAELESVTVDRIVIKHISGYTYNRVLPSEKLTYVVTSEDAQYEALGTAFKTATTGDEQSVEVYHSKVVETGLNVTPEAGEKLTVINKPKPSENGKIEKLDIEKVKSDPFLQWNRELDEKDENYKASLGFLSDITGPEVTLNSNDGDVTLLEPSAAEGTIEISGSTESGAKLTVLSKSKSGATPVDVTVGSDGKFTTPVLSAPLGDSVFEFIATDRVGNKTTKTVRITFQRKSQPVAGNAVSFILTAVKDSDKKKISISWKLNGIETPDGVKLVYSKSAKPTYNPNGIDEVKPEYISSGSNFSIDFILN